jgi:hypothetical protein
MNNWTGRTIRAAKKNENLMRSPSVATLHGKRLNKDRPESLGIFVTHLQVNGVERVVDMVGLLF